MESAIRGMALGLCSGTLGVATSLAIWGEDVHVLMMILLTFAIAGLCVTTADLCARFVVSLQKQEAQKASQAEEKAKREALEADLAKSNTHPPSDW